MYKWTLVNALVIGIFMLPALAIAKPEIVVDMKAEKEVEQIVNGKKTIKRIKAENADPGQKLIFTLRYTNKGNEKATNVKVDNPIPKEARYVVGSGTGKNSKMLFSIDGGKTFKLPSLLTYEETDAKGKKHKRKASPEQYTHVRWIIKEVPPGKSGQVGFHAMVK